MFDSFQGYFSEELPMKLDEVFELPEGTTEIVVDKKLFLDLLGHHFKLPVSDVQIEESNDGALSVRIAFRAEAPVAPKPSLLTS
jgi:hypothetical protein